MAARKRDAKGRFLKKGAAKAPKKGAAKKKVAKKAPKRAAKRAVRPIKVKVLSGTLMLANRGGR